MKLDADYWDERYKQHETGWDLGMVSPALSHYFQQIENKNAAILIPGCGNAHEAALLLEYGFTNITILDISPTLTNILKEQWADNNNIQILCEDFFEHQGQYDYVIEQTFFCAIHPDRRKAYAEQVSKLLKPGGILAGLLFDKQFPHDGPPFGGLKQEYQDLFSGYFKEVHIRSCTESAKPRIGTEVFIEVFGKPS